MHAIEERLEMRLSEVDLSLSSLDVLEPNFVSEVYASNGRGRYFDFTKLSMKQLCTLSE
jgi:hypothetical protein